MTQMVNVIRNAGNNNVILVPCAEQGQDESVLINRGHLSYRQNTTFCLMCTPMRSGSWFQISNGKPLATTAQIKASVFLERWRHNAGALMNPAPFLDSAYRRIFIQCLGMEI